MSHGPFVDDRLDKDMVEIRKIMDVIGTNPVFTVEFQRNNDNNIVVCIKSERICNMPTSYTTICTLEQAGEALVEYVKNNANNV